MRGMSNPVVPELSVSDWRKSIRFYCDILGFSIDYTRPEEGFAYLRLGQAELMIDQIGIGRDFDNGHLPGAYPFGRGVNLQIEVENVVAIAASLQAYEVPLMLPIEDKWYRVNEHETGNRQFVVADPDGYLLRFFEKLGVRPSESADMESPDGDGHLRSAESAQQ
ncbi:VOC family protein [Lipomyces kononenkoae]|uniref:VOC family protein n=1 Tax=Lipomyces kononenkoae TaxID=34357 RepID=A0ACC3T4X5_LIPKO